MSHECQVKHCKATATRFFEMPGINRNWFCGEHHRLAVAGELDITVTEQTSEGELQGWEAETYVAPTN